MLASEAFLATEELAHLIKEPQFHAIYYRKNAE